MYMPKNNPFYTALDIISQRRQNAKNQLKSRETEIFNKIPEILELKKELSLTNIKLSKIILSSKDIDKLSLISQLKSDNLHAQQMIVDILIANGYPGDYLTINFKCSKCNDTAFYEGNKCICINNLINKLRIEQLNKSCNLTISDFSTFNLEYYRTTNLNDYNKMEKILNYCIKYALNFDNNSNNVLMIGNTGLGKTHLSLAIANKVIESGFDAIYGSAQELLRKIEKEHFSKINSFSKSYTLDILLSVPLLIIDDLGAEFESNFYTSALYNIINSRINKKIPTIINTNLNKNQIESQYDQRIASRLLHFHILGFVGEDVRGKINYKR